MTISNGRRACRPTIWRLAVPVFAMLCCAAPAGAAIIAYWDFNDSNLEASQGTGSLSLSFSPSSINYPGGTTQNALPDIDAGKALNLRGNANNGESLLFALSTTGHEGLVMSFATRRSNTGFNHNQLAYSVDGGASFTDLGEPYNPPTSFGVLVYDFSSLDDLNDNPSVQVRITLDGATNNGGRNWMDNVLFTATPMPDPNDAQLPEPALMILLALGSIAVGWRRR
jgi:hypothetical protein